MWGQAPLWICSCPIVLLLNLHVTGEVERFYYEFLNRGGTRRVDWVACHLPPLGQHSQKVNTRKKNGITWVPKNVEIREIDMHANAKSSTAV